MKIFLLSVVLCSQTIGLALLAPIMPFPPLFFNVGRIYTSQWVLGEPFRDLAKHLRPNEISDFLDGVDPAMKYRNAMHPALYGGRFGGGFNVVSQAIEESDPKVAGPAHDSLKSLRAEIGKTAPQQNES